MYPSMIPNPHDSQSRGPWNPGDVQVITLMISRARPTNDVRNSEENPGGSPEADNPVLKYNGEADKSMISGLCATCEEDLPLCTLVVVGLEIEDNTHRLQSKVFASTSISKHLFHLLLREAVVRDGVRGFVV